jgi:hypothetical protein
MELGAAVDSVCPTHALTRKPILMTKRLAAHDLTFVLIVVSLISIFSIVLDSKVCASLPSVLQQARNMPA